MQKWAQRRLLELVRPDLCRSGGSCRHVYVYGDVDVDVSEEGWERPLAQGGAPSNYASAWGITRCFVRGPKPQTHKP